MSSNITKLIALGLVNLTAFMGVISSSAMETDIKGNSIESVEYQNTKDEDFTNLVAVYARIASEYKVTIPKTIVLSGVDKKASYIVKIEGDIAGYESIKVKPEESFKLFSKNKDSVDANVIQDKILWTVSDFDTDASGNIKAKDITAGKWSGLLNFNIIFNSEDILPEILTQLTDKTGRTMVLGSIILPEEDEINVLNTLLDTGMVKNENDVDKIVQINSLPEDLDVITINVNQPDDTKIALISNTDNEIKYLGTGTIKDNEATINIESEKITEVATQTEEGETVTTYKAGFYDSDMNIITSWDDLISYGWDPQVDCVAKTFNDSNKKAKILSSIIEEHPEIKNATTIIFEEGIRNAGETIFRAPGNIIHMTNVDTLIFPNSMEKKIGEIIGTYLPNLKNIRIRDDNPHFVSKDGVVYTKNMDSLVFCPPAKTKLIIPETVKVLSYGCLAYNKAETIGDKDSGADIILPDSLEELEKQAMCRCLAKHIELPKNVKIIHTEVFCNAKELKTLYVPSSIVEWDRGLNSLQLEQQKI